MSWLKIVYLCVYGALLIAYMACKALRVSRRFRGPVKMALSAMFVGVGVSACIFFKGETLAVVLTVGLAFAAAGDFFLVFMDKRANFHRGVVAFGIANAVMIAYSVLSFGWRWWSLAVFAVLYAANIVLQKTGVYSYGKSAVYLNVYLVLVGYNGSLGITLISGGTANLSAFLFGLGALLFFLSDLCLGIHAYKLRRRSVDVMNSLLYFSGLMLIAVSLWM